MSKGYGGIDISDDDTDISDVDPDEMAKMIQDVDDLDKTLFGPTLEKRPGQSKRGPIKSVLHSSKDSADKPKAHVSFVDADVDLDDDLLEDLLSMDGDKKKKKNASVQPSRFDPGANAADVAVKATPIAELFGITDGKTTARETSDWLGLKPVDSPLKTVDSRVGPRKESSMPPVEHRNLKPTATNVGTKVSEKSSPEVLGRAVTSTVTETRSGIVPQASPRKADSLLFANNGDSDRRPRDGLGRGVSARPPSGPAAPPSEPATPREFRRQRNSSGFVDPLGLFASPSAQQEPVSTLQTAEVTEPAWRVVETDHARPAWLGGTGDAPPSPRRAEPQSRPTSGQRAVETGPRSVVDENLLKLVAGTSVEQQTAASLERQELQLTAALQLKQHEDRLAMMLSRQQMTLQRQEDQLQTLVDRQLERQQMIEQQMNEQQNRITAHINTLTCQPGLPAPVGPPSIAEVTNHQQVVASLEAENSQLRSTLETLHGKHGEEMAWLKESYKRQLEILEASLSAQECRLKAECVNITRDYETRLLRLEEEIKSLHRQNAEKVTALQADHLLDVQRLRAEQDSAMQDLRKHQEFLLEHMNNSWKAERANVQGSQDPATLSTILREVSQCKQAVAELHDRSQLVQQAGKTEVQLTEMHDALDRAKEERCKLQALVASLEREIIRQRSQFDEDRQSMRQDIARLERERCSAVEYTERERRELQKLKEDALVSANEERARIEDTKLWLATERSRLATLSRLQDDGKKAVDAERAEAEAALRVAQEAARSADEDRERLLAERLTVSQEQRRLEHLRLNLGRKAQDLDNLTQLAVSTKEEALRALESAAQREREQTMRAVNIQKQAEALAERERKLSDERQLVSRERVSLRVTRPHKPNTWLLADDTDKAVVDPRLVIMKLKANQDNSLGDLDSHYISSYFSISK